MCYDLAHQIRCAKHTFSGQCDITPMVCCSFGGHSTPQFLQCRDACQAPSVCVKARDACQAPSKARDTCQAPSICVKARDACQAPSVCVKARDACQAPTIMCQG